MQRWPNLICKIRSYQKCGLALRPEFALFCPHVSCQPWNQNRSYLMACVQRGNLTPTGFADSFRARMPRLWLKLEQIVDVCLSTDCFFFVEPAQTNSWLIILLTLWRGCSPLLIGGSLILLRPHIFVWSRFASNVNVGCYSLHWHALQRVNRCCQNEGWCYKNHRRFE